MLVAIFVTSFFTERCEHGTTGRCKQRDTQRDQQSFCKRGCPRGDGSGRVGCSSCNGRRPSRYGIFLGFLGNPLATRLDRSRTGWNLWVWIWNFGLTLPLSMVLVVALFFDRDFEARCFVWTASALFAICCLFVFAPWEWDNMKLMLWSWLVIVYLWKKILAPLGFQRAQPSAWLCSFQEAYR